MIDLERLNQYIISLTSQPQPQLDVLIEEWIKENCYITLLTKLTDDFVNKLNHNLQIAKRMDDTQYVKYISMKLKLDVDISKWIYVPNKIKLTVRKTVPDKGFKIDAKIANFIGVPNDTVFTYVSDIVKHIHTYIYNNQLQNRYDKLTITPNDELSAILTPLGANEREYTYLNLPSHINGIKPLG
jgi:chromatin remodeling complex protein RSC6